MREGVHERGGVSEGVHERGGVSEGVREPVCVEEVCARVWVRVCARECG